MLSSYLQKCCKQRTGLIEMGKNTEILLKQQINAERYQNLSFSIPANVYLCESCNLCKHFSCYDLILGGS